MRKVFLFMCCGLLFPISKTDGRIQEKTDVVCNGPCGQLSLSCPADHRVAIRDAVYRVQDRTDSCKAFPGCDKPGQDVCCDPIPQDCVFGYSPAHLKVLQRNCSGNPACVIQTERSDVETVQCSSTDVKNLSSHTILNYVCVNDSVVADICSPQEKVIQGKTLFAMIDPRESSRPMKGSVCTCIAESTKWPTTNNIAMFLVDMRLNTLESEECSNASLSIRSGSNRKSLDCKSTRDPRVNFPFVALLNDSNVAHLRLQLTHSLPEFIWLGFEANEDEDIRLACKLEGLVPTDSATETPTIRDIEKVIEIQTPVMNTEPPFEDKNQAPGKAETPLAAIIGGIAAAFLLIIIIIVVIVIIFVIRKKKPTGQDAQAEGEEPDGDIIYYSTTEEDLRAVDPLRKNTEAVRDSTDSTKELYIPVEEVVANKRKNKAKKVRIISTPDYVQDLGDDYVSTFQILERKRESRKAKSKANNDNTAADNSNSTTTTTNNNYDRLERLPARPSDSIMESYDQLEPDVSRPVSYSAIPEFKVQRSESKRPLVSSGSGGTINTAYEETELPPKRLPILSPVAAGDLYFELEIPSKQRHSANPYCDHHSVIEKAPRKISVDNIVSLAHSKPGDTPKTPALSLLSVNPSDTRRPSTTSVASNQSTDGSIYNDASSEAAPSGTDTSNSKVVGRPQSLGKDLAERPVTAPRRKSKEHISSPNYDVAKPIQ